MQQIDDGRPDPGSTSWLFREMTTLRPHRTARVSSWDRSGRNRDFIMLPPHVATPLAEIDGPGCVQYFYAALLSNEHEPLRSLVLRMYWDGEAEPSVEAPFGDFFGVAGGTVRYFSSLLLAVNPGGFGPGRCDGFNCYFPMPFASSARIEVTNDTDVPAGPLWYHVNYERFAELDPTIGRFHAQWRRENPTVAEPQPSGLWQGANLSGERNYVLLEAEGQGNLAGIVLHVDNLSGGWWGEGDDMIFVDGEPFPPSFHGTGTEEVFGGGACPGDEYAGPYHGFHLIEDPRWGGKTGMYRFYVHDPVRFQRSLRVTIEHGHNNDLANDYSSMAYWYQREPHRPFPPLPPREARLPRRSEIERALLARETALGERLGRVLRRVPWQQANELRLDLTKPVRTALWRHEWELAGRLIDLGDAQLAAIEQALPPEEPGGGAA
ncbi:MAG TPA: glycoside hydrolase family 172 protein [Dehalococcoidia bacterium]|nr:glycoside hydrolase family 172 protein [Dehalococcoidia bacterium]